MSSQDGIVSWKADHKMQDGTPGRMWMEGWVVITQILEQQYDGLCTS
jgi:hypothetical protein